MSSLALNPTEFATAQRARNRDLPSGQEGMPTDSSGIDYYARSFGDPISRLFWYQNELHLGLLAPAAANFAKLVRSDLYQKLVADCLLFELHEAAMHEEVFAATYRLDRTPRITYWHEWSPRMLRTAALRMLELLTRLAAAGLTIRNPHPWNLLFDGRHFIFANSGSIVSLDAETFERSYEKIARFFIRPLLLVEHGFEHTARQLIKDVRDGVLLKDVQFPGSGWAESTRGMTIDQIPMFLASVSRRIQELRAPSTADRWLDYFETDCDFSEGSSWSQKQAVLLEMLNRDGIQSVLDLGANTGHYAKLAAERGREVMAADFDSALVDRIYKGSLSSHVSLYPAVLDFTHPTPADGVEYRWFPAATERYSADLVLCFALTHHMVFGRYRLDFEQIARGIRSFSRRYALVEYVDRGKIRPADWRPDADRWYSVSAFATAMREHFESVEILPPANDGRRLLICGPRGRAA
jgi:SAM-dependent methyltransferase